MIILKGSPKGISVSVDDTDLETGKTELTEKLMQSKAFFDGVSLEVFLTSNSLTEMEVFDLQKTVSKVLCDTEITFIEYEPKMIPKKHSPLDELGSDEGITRFCRRTIKSGETVEYDNNLVVIGDVEVGAKIVAGGNVFVLGSLFGSVHAGAGGKKDAAIVAMKLMPEKLLIADFSTEIKQSTIKRLFSNVPEIAYISGNSIKVEQYT
ncbi:MAG: hypothetical protein IKU87_00220 [Clostridia bacterium]|nr:hypothetical protein [Clostridia bacterium]